jgi:hypothetical protein
VDSVLLKNLPPSTDTAARATLRRMIEVSTGVIVPAEELEKDPLANAVALMDLTDAIAKNGAVSVMFVSFLSVSTSHYVLQKNSCCFSVRSLE